MENNYKTKKLTLEQIIISLDRLTRFKPTEEKYLRVFKDIIISNLIYPKFKKSQLNSMDYNVLVDLVNLIFSNSLKQLNIEASNNYDINENLEVYENSVFKIEKNATILLENKIDYQAFLNFIPDEPVNLKWLKSLNKPNLTACALVKNRKTQNLKFPIEKIVIVEGITEEILLPKFAKILGYDFNQEGIKIISAGGKNAVVKLFYQFADILKIPMFVLLDDDAKENYNEILPKLRAQDKVHVLQSGEFEDTLPLFLIKRTINHRYKNYFEISIDDIRHNLPMTEILENLFRSVGLEFKKAEFATLVKQNVISTKDISDEIKNVVLEIMTKND